MSKTKVMVTKPGSASSHGPGFRPDPVIACENCAVIHHATTLSNDRHEIKRDLAEQARYRQQHRRQRRIDEFEIGAGIARIEVPAPAAPAARPRTTADSPWSCRCPRSPEPARRPSARCSRAETGYRAALATTDISARARFREVRKLQIHVANDASRMLYRRSSPPSAPRTSARPTEPPSEPPTDLPRSATTPPTTLLVTERVTSARDHLAGRHPAARYIGAENRADDRTDLCREFRRRRRHAAIRPSAARPFRRRASAASHRRIRNRSRCRICPSPGCCP